MPGQPEQLRIVIADDNDDAANTLAKLLMVNGYRVQAIAHDGHSALDSIRQLLPDVAILDIGMPEMSGNTVAKSVRTQVEPCPFLIALSGLGSELHQDQAFAAGFDANLTKPAAWHDLNAILLAVSKSRS